MRQQSEPHPASASEHGRWRPGYVSESDLHAAVGEDGRVVGGAKGVRGVASCGDAPTHHGAIAPFDLNLQCICCRQMFRKGEIQAYRQHVLECAVRL